MMMAWRRARALLLAGACMASGVSSWAQVAPAVSEPSALAEAWVHCLFPGQVRRLGAFSTSVTPRRAAKVTPAACRAGGGEYVEAHDPHEAVRRIWLPMAADGVPDAQLTVGEWYEQQGQAPLARHWYEKAAAQGMPRAQFNLAALLERTGGPAQAERVQQLLVAASGGHVAGLLWAHADNGPRVEFVAPEQALRLPRGPEHLIELASAGVHTVSAHVHAPAGVAELQLNGAATPWDASGTLQHQLEVKDRPMPVAVAVRDRQGQRAEARVVLVHRSAAPAVSALERPASPAARATIGRRHALVVANQRYAHWPALDTPVADAQAVADVLASRFGYQTTLIKDVNRAELLQALVRLRQQVGPEDQVVLYYAGHGQMDDATARGYWIPVDGDPKDLSRWVSVIDVTDQLAAMAARHVLVIADSCYSGTLTRSLIPRVDHALSLSQRHVPVAHLERQKVRVALTSGGLEPVVDGGSIEHSLFARSLLDVLRQVNGPVAAQELFGAVSARFSHLGSRLKLTQQPQFAPIGFAGHEAGDFVLTPL